MTSINARGARRSAAPPGPALGPPGLALGVPAPTLQLRLDPLKVRRRPVQAPPVSQQRQNHDDQHPDRPELAIGAVDQPDRRAQGEQGDPAPALLKEAPLELGPPSAMLGQLRRAADRQRRQVTTDLGQVPLGARGVGPPPGARSARHR
jgi:hypothetical protein